VFLERLGGVLAVGTGFAVQAEPATGAGLAFRFASLAVSGPAAEVPSAEGPDAFFAAVSST